MRTYLGFTYRRLAKPLNKKSRILAGLVVLGLLLVAGVASRGGKLAEASPVLASSFPDSCGLEAVVCSDEKSKEQLDIEKIIKSISILETNECQTGVGLHKRNPTGIRNAQGYLTFASCEEGLDYSADLWERLYSNLGLEDALAKWKTGNPQDRSAATKRYINNFYKVYNQL